MCQFRNRPSPSLGPANRAPPDSSTYSCQSSYGSHATILRRNLIFVIYSSKCYTVWVTAAPPCTFRVFASKPFMRFARRFGIGNDEILDTVRGPCDADLGGGVFKFRLAREGEGSSGGARALIAMKIGQRAVLMFGFEKKDLANIKPDELKGYRKAARIYLGYTDAEITAIVKEKALFEIAPSRKGAGNGKGLQERGIRSTTRKHV